MLSLKKWIKTELRIYRNPLEPSQGDLRLIKILSYLLSIFGHKFFFFFICHKKVALLPYTHEFIPIPLT